MSLLKLIKLLGGNHRICKMSFVFALAQISWVTVGNDFVFFLLVFPLWQMGTVDIDYLAPGKSSELLGYRSSKSPRQVSNEL